jgi:hypothetical protein
MIVSLRMTTNVETSRSEMTSRFREAVAVSWAGEVDGWAAVEDGEGMGLLFE